jgi:hypothetical protein
MPVKGSHRIQTETKKTPMKTKLSLLAAGLFLTAFGTGLGQSTVQFVTTNSSVPDWASSTAVPD